MEGISSLRRRPGGTPFFLLTGVAFLPYWLAWWTQFSFDARFTLIFMPLVGVWAALILHDLSGRIEGRISVPAWFSRLLTILTLVPLSLLATHSRWGGVYRALTQPLASYDARVAEVNSRSYELSQWVIHNLDPAETRIAVMDGKMLYYLIGYDVTQMYPLNLDSLEEFDYLIHSSSLFAVYGPTLGWETSEFYQHIWDPMIFEPVFVSDGVNIMRVLRTTLPTPEERQQFNEPASKGGDQ
jgi:hypothetical protein